MNPVSYLSKLDRLRMSPKTKKNLPRSVLVEKALSRGEGILSTTGALAVTTGKYTGRSPNDKFIVKDQLTEERIRWGKTNQPFSEEAFEALYDKVIQYLNRLDERFLFSGYAGADKNHRISLEVITEYAWHNLFAQNLFIEPEKKEANTGMRDFTVISAPGFKANPAVDQTNSEAFIIISFSRKVVLIGGTEYAGEMKKSIFSVMNYLLPERNVLPMHCSANVGAEGDVALFFGLSGTGKTTLSAAPDRALIGDDEHGWSENGIFNIEGGCYAKCIHLSREKEPQIWNAITFGAVLENVVLDRTTRIADYHDTRHTENTRAAYGLNAVDRIVRPSLAGHPNTIVFLTADASGVLPPLSILTKEQAMYHFLSGYTSKLAGTERGVTSPVATFSTCFGEPFLPLPPARYANMLGQKIEQHDVTVFLINTGWTGGPYGTGKRIPLEYTRAMVTAALNGELQNVETRQDDVFQLHSPLHCPGVPDQLLQPKKTWPDPKAYERKARELARQFQENFKKFPHVQEAVRAAGPR